MMITNKINLDLQTPGIVPTIHAVQNDSYSRNLEITLFSDRKPFVFPENGTVVIRYKKSDGKGGEYDTLPDGSAAWWAERNVLTVALAPQVLTTPGSVHLSVSLIAEGKQLSIFPIHLAVAPIAAGKSAKSENYFYITGLLPAPVSGNVGQYLRIAGINSEGRITAVEAADNESFHTSATYGLPVLHLTGDTAGMSKDNAVSLDYVFGERSGTATVKWQGSSSLAYPKKNYSIQFDHPFEAAGGWGEQSKYCLKANYIDHSHARNVVSAKLWGQMVKSRPKEAPNNVNLFDITKITHFTNHIGSVIDWSYVSGDALVVTNTCYNNGYNYAIGQTFSEGDYTISFDVVNETTATIESLMVGFGIGNQVVEGSRAVNSNLQTSTHYEFTVTNTVPNGYFYVIPSKADASVSVRVTNINISRTAETNLFDISKITHFKDNSGNTIDWALVANDFIVVVNTAYNGGYCYAVGQTYPVGKYTISFDVLNRATSTVEALITGFGVDNTTSQVTLPVNDSLQTAMHFEATVSNTTPNAYFFVVPSVADGSVNLAITNIKITQQGSASGGSDINYRLSNLVNGGAVDGFPVLIMLNNNFQGLYTFNIPKDGWMMDMGNGSQEAILCADYSDACWFKGEATLNGDFKVEYVSDENNADWVLDSVNRLINAVMDSDGTDIDAEVAQYLDIESAIDHLIIVSMIGAGDVVGKNYLLSTYDGVKWFFTPYDMDNTYGLEGAGTELIPADRYIILEDCAHKALQLIIEHKTAALKARYAELRDTVLSEDNVVYAFENFASTIPVPVLLEDVKHWPTIPSSAVNNVSQIRDWYKRRITVMDKVVEAL